jgi:hypothetical protein
MGIQSQGPLQDLGAFLFSGTSRLFFSGSETLLTRCPYEADGISFFGRNLIRTQERTVGVDTLGPYNLSICRVLGSGCRMFGFRFLVLVLGLRTLKHLRAWSEGLYLRYHSKDCFGNFARVFARVSLGDGSISLYPEPYTVNHKSRASIFKPYTLDHAEIIISRVCRKKSEPLGLTKDGSSFRV